MLVLLLLSLSAILVVAAGKAYQRSGQIIPPLVAKGESRQHSTKNSGGGTWFVPTPPQEKEGPAQATPTATATPSPVITGTATVIPDAWIPHTSTPARQVTATSSPTRTPTATPTPTVTPLPASDGVSRAMRVPILMYHYLSAPPAGSNVYRQDLSVSPEQFDAQLRYLRDEGYHTISLRDLLYALNRGWSLPDNPIVLTFDDGYADNYANALPLLQKYGFTATFFVLTAYVDEQRAGYLTWQQIEEMNRRGMEIGSHSKDHPDLRHRGRDFLVWQILGSRQSIEAHTHEPVYAFSYPSGRYDMRVEQVLKEAGYLAAVTIEQGTDQRAGHALRLERIRVRGEYNVDKFAEMLAYWMEH